MSENTESEKNYKLSLSGNDITVHKEVSEEIAHKILLLLVPSNTTKLISMAGIDGGSVTVGEVTPKEFILQKRPSTDIEKITCLAYYLAHYRKIHEFKTEELTDLNREAQQIRFSNPSASARNAVQFGYLALVGGGKKQLTTLGEEVVSVMPDRDKVKAALENNYRRRPRRSSKKATGEIPETAE